MSLAGLLNQSIVIYTKSSYNSQGREVLGGVNTVRARVQPKSKNVMSPTGAILTIAAIAYVLPNTTVSVDDKVTYDSSAYKVYSKYPVADGQGTINHIKLELIRWQT